MSQGIVKLVLKRTTFNRNLESLHRPNLEVGHFLLFFVSIRLNQHILSREDKMMSQGNYYHCLENEQFTIKSSKDFEQNLRFISQTFPSFEVSHSIVFFIDCG